MSVWKDFCRVLEQKKTKKHLGNLVPEIDRHSIFEFTKEQSEQSQECNPADFAIDEDYPLPPFPFPKVCIVHHDGVIALREPYMDEETGILEFDVVTYTTFDSDKNQSGGWALSTGSVQVDTTQQDEDGEFKWDVFDMAGLLMNKGDVYHFDEDNPISMHQEDQDNFHETREVMRDVKAQLNDRLKAAKESLNKAKVEEVEDLLRSFDGLKADLKKYEDAEEKAFKQLNEHAENINEMTIETLRKNFYGGLQNIAWINHPDHYTVEMNPESRPKKPKKGRIARWTEREHHILLSRHEIAEEWQRIHQGGTHASPMPHLRRGHYKTLRAPRYKDARGKRIWVRATHVNGECVEWRDGATSYKVV